MSSSLDPIKPGLLACFSLWLSRFSRLVLFLALLLLIGSGIVYSRLIDREGFPQIEFPINVISVNYFVDDLDRADTELAQPLSQALIGHPEVESLETTSQPNGLIAVVTFVEGFESDQGPALIRQQLAEVDWPDRATVDINVVQLASYLGRYDAVIAVYQPDAVVPLPDLQAVADQAVGQLDRLPAISLAETVPLEVADTEQPGNRRQISFNQIGLNQSGDNLEFHRAVFVGVSYDREAIDALGLSTLLHNTLPQMNLVDEEGRSYAAVLAGDFAEPINRQVRSLQNNLLTGLVAIVIVSFLLISWRAALITILFMASVVLTTIGILYLLGQTLNTVVLFSLVLALGLFVDDATIIVEAIEARRRQANGSWQSILRGSLGRVVSASWVGTLTTVLVFVPLFLISGLLGDIIRLLPATIIVSLLVSFLLSISLIPVLSRQLILRSKQRADWLDRINPFPDMMQALGRACGWLPTQLAGPHRKLAASGLALLLVGGLGLLVWSSNLSRTLDFNIFPAVRDGDYLTYQLEFPPDYDLPTAEVATESVQLVAANALGHENIEGIYYGLGQQLPNQRQASAVINLVPYQTRSLTSSTLAERLDLALGQHLAGSGVEFWVVGSSLGPPVGEFPLQVLVVDDDPVRARQLAQLVNDYLLGSTLEAPNGSLIRVTDSRVESAAEISRRDGQRTLSVGFKFDNENISAVLRVAKEAVNDRFTPEFLASEGFAPESIDFDLGQESDNIEAFASLQYAFPVTILAIYILLTLQFRSLTKPFLMLVAIPLSLPGVVIFLSLTNTPLSFFVLLGLVGLGGIVVNNTILLTEYANQQRRAGLPPSLAIAAAVRERLLPLVATTLTTLVALTPLIVNEPVWEALAGVIVAGLISSTLMVILVFPSFYLGSGWIWRRWVRPYRRQVLRFLWRFLMRSLGLASG